MSAEVCINLLLRGAQAPEEDGSPEEDDDYVQEFANHNLTAKTVPVLKFQFKNIQSLAKLLSETKEVPSETSTGLIITSPRVVEALRQAKQLLPGESSSGFFRISPDNTFVVGERTGALCKLLLNLEVNSSSSESGKGRVLGEFIRDYTHNKRGTINLIYPKGSRSGNDIEDALAGQSNVNIKTVIVYDTEAIENLAEVIFNRLVSFRLSDDTIKVNINMIFFSPSGVEGYSKINQDRFITRIQETLNTRHLNINYASIGSTTELAISRAGLKILCVSERPNPKSLVESLIKSLAKINAGLETLDRAPLT